MSQPTATGTATADVIVIGAGVQGASLAFHLAERGVRVIVVERSGVAAGATGRSSGLVRMHYDLLARPAWPGPRTRTSATGQRAWAATVASRGRGSCGSSRPRVRPGCARTWPHTGRSASTPPWSMPTGSGGSRPPWPWRTARSRPMSPSRGTRTRPAPRRLPARGSRSWRPVGPGRGGDGDPGGGRPCDRGRDDPGGLRRTGRGQRGRWLGCPHRTARWAGHPRHRVAPRHGYVGVPASVPRPLPVVIDNPGAQYLRPEGAGLALIGLEDEKRPRRRSDRDTADAEPGFALRVTERVVRRGPGLAKARSSRRTAGRTG